jgi:hypothetical protein
MFIARAIIVMTYADHPAALQPRATNIAFETTREHGAPGQLRSLAWAGARLHRSISTSGNHNECP